LGQFGQVRAGKTAKPSAARGQFEAATECLFTFNICIISFIFACGKQFYAKMHKKRLIYSYMNALYHKYFE